MFLSEIFSSLSLYYKEKRQTIIIQFYIQIIFIINLQCSAEDRGQKLEINGDWCGWTNNDFSVSFISQKSYQVDVE